MLLSIKKSLVASILILCLFAPAPSISAEPQEAPAWKGTEWINLPKGVGTLDVIDLRGKVVYLSFFQKW